MTSSSSYIALDVGEVRIGVAYTIANTSIAKPSGIIKNDEHVFEAITELATKHHAQAIIIGLPRGLRGQNTDQTSYAMQFGQRLQKHVDIPLIYQDEALTSHRAQQELAAAGKQPQQGDIDALAASYILQDYISEKVSA